MRHGVPGPDELDEGGFHTEATFIHRGSQVTVPVGAGNRIWHLDQAPSTRISEMQIPLFDQTETINLLEAGLVGTAGHRVRLKAFSDKWHQPWSLGEYLVTRAVQDGPTVQVDADDLTRLPIDHHARAPYGVYQGATFKMILHDLFAEDNVRITFDRRLPNTVIPQGFAVAVNRWESIQELLTAWGAVIVPGTYTGVHVVPIGSEITEPSVTFADTTGGTLVGATMELERSDLHNHIRVEIHDSEAVAEAFQRTGIYRVDTYGWRTRTIASDAITSYAQGQAVAVSELARERARTVTVPVEAIPDWRIEAYEPVAVQSDHIHGWGRVTGSDLPLTADLSAVYHVGMEV